MFRCVDICEIPTKYVDQETRECLSACPSGIHDENDTCVASLNECEFYRLENSGTSRVCVSACNEGERVEAR